jgi:hypothetical protein
MCSKDLGLSASALHLTVLHLVCITSVLKYTTLLIFAVRLTIHLFYIFFANR